jgi:inositol phosphorylceramide mannosyltransferase catalytic subunit
MYRDVPITLSSPSIPKKLHLIWVGGALMRPESCIDSWRLNHPDWQFKLWTDRELYGVDWINQSHIQSCAKAGRWSSVADLMRYEILYREGGVYADASSFSLRPLDEWLLENEMFACWRNTFAKGRARRVSNAFLGGAPRTDFLRFVIQTIHGQNESLRPRRPFGAPLLTQCIADYDDNGYYDISVLPSHLFPQARSGRETTVGRGVVFTAPASAARPVAWPGRPAARLTPSRETCSLPDTGGHAHSYDH